MARSADGTLSVHPETVTDHRAGGTGVEITVRLAHLSLQFVVEHASGAGVCGVEIETSLEGGTRAVGQHWYAGSLFVQLDEDVPGWHGRPSSHLTRASVMSAAEVGGPVLADPLDPGGPPATADLAPDLGENVAVPASEPRVVLAGNADELDLPAEATVAYDPGPGFTCTEVGTAVIAVIVAADWSPEGVFRGAVRNSVECVAATCATLDCDDHDPCTADACVADACTHDPIPDCGGEVACGDLPAILVDALPDPPGTYDPAVWTCPDSCTVTTTEPPFPPAAGDCIPGLSLGTTETGVLFAQTNSGAYRILGASAPVDRTYSRALLTAGVTASVAVSRISDAARYDLTVVPGDGTWDVRSFGPGTGPIPRFGATIPCPDRHVYTSGTVRGTETVFVELCDETLGSYGICTWHGADVATSPEAETCTSSYAIELGYTTAGSSPGPYARRGSGFTISSHSHGTGTFTVVAIPLDTDVTFVVSDSVEIVVRWSGTTVEVISYRRL